MAKIMNRMLVIGLAIFSISISAHALPIEDCRIVSDNMNKSMPRKVDELTTLDTTYCIQEQGNVTFCYKYTLNISKEESAQIPQLTKNDMKNSMRNYLEKKLCDSTIMKSMLKYSNIKYEYFLKNGESFNTMIFSKKDCS